MIKDNRYIKYSKKIKMRNISKYPIRPSPLTINGESKKKKKKNASVECLVSERPTNTKYPREKNTIFAW